MLALFLAQSIFILNPQVTLDAQTLLRVWICVALTYGLAAGLAIWLLLFLIEEVRGGPLRPAWMSFRLLIWLLALDLGLAATLLWHNLFYYRVYITPESIRALAIAATILSAAAAILLTLALFHYSFGRRAARFGYSLVFLIWVVSLISPLYFRPINNEASSTVPRLPLEDNPSPRRVTIIGMEGASMSYVLPAVAEGKLPNFARLIEGGASGALRTIRPTESLAVWTSIATGKLPRQHGLLGFYRYRFPGIQSTFSLLPHGLFLQNLEHLGLLKRTAVTSTQRRTGTFWSILSSFGVKVGLLRWWGTYPAEAIDGFIVSEYFHRQVRERFDPTLPDLTYPAGLFPELAPLVVQPQDIEASELERFVDRSVDIPGDTLPWESVLRSSLADDATYQRAGRWLRESQSPHVYAIYFFGLDNLGHTFFRYHRPDSFGDVSELELKKYGRAIDAYYSHLDTILGEYLQSLQPEETLVVVSGHGMEPLSVPRRVVEALKSSSHLTGYHEGAPDGLALFYGPGIAQGVNLQGASVVDITPTLLYLMGLPIGQDMEGNLLAAVLEESLSRTQPVTFISSYHNFLIGPRREEESFERPSPLDDLPQAFDNRN